MRMINTRAPDISWDSSPKRREATTHKLKRIADIIRASGDDIKSIPIASELRLSPDDLEYIIRSFKEVRVPTTENTVDVKEWNQSLRSSERWDDTIVPWLLILQSPVTHTNICNLKQIDHPRYSIASSVVMLAAREAQDLPYSYWYNAVENGSLGRNRLFFTAFAKTLGIVDVEVYDSIEITDTDRNYLIKNNNPRGWYLNKFEGPKFENATKWHYYIKHMKLGTWIFHESVRDENSMIFHPSNWDYVPERTKPVQKSTDDFSLFI